MGWKREQKGHSRSEYSKRTILASLLPRIKSESERGSKLSALKGGGVGAVSGALPTCAPAVVPAWPSRY